MSNLSTVANDIYTNSLIYHQQQRCKENKQKFGILFTDVDDTMYHPNHPLASWDAYQYFAEKDWPIIAVTGNSYQGVLKRVESEELPPFAAIVGCAGTSIHLRYDSTQNHATAYKKDHAFEDHIFNLGFDRSHIASIAHKLVEELRQSHPQWLFDFQYPDREQVILKDKKLEPEEQFKVSFFFSISSLDDVQTIKKLLTDRFPNHPVLISDHTAFNRLHPESTQKRYCIDILAIGKGGAVSYLAEKYSIKTGFVAGDSGNDIHMLLDTPPFLAAILVGGAKPEAIAAVDEATIKKIAGSEWRVIKSNKNQEKLCFVESDPDRFGPDSIIAAAQSLSQIHPLS